jgi:prevent-host-death family protein
MTIVTITGEDARNHWGEMMDTALMGGRVVIKRHDKPRAVLIGHAQWEEIEQQLAELAQLRRRYRLERAKQALAARIKDPSQGVTQEEYERLLAEAGLQR